MTTIGPTNVELAEALEQMAELLVRRGEHNPYRVQAYLHAAGTVRELDVPVATIYGDGGKEALTDLPGVGVSLAGHLAQYVETGRIGLRDRLLASSDPVSLLETLPSVGHRLAVRLVDELGAPVDVPEHWLPFLKLDFGVCTPSLALVEACLGSLARALPSTAPLSSLDAVRCWLSRGLDARAQDHR